MNGVLEAEEIESGRESSEWANVYDIEFLLQTLSEHFANGPGTLEEFNFLESESLQLRNMFNSLEEYYAFGEGADQVGSQEVWILYDQLTMLFGERSDYDLEKWEVEQLFDDFQSREFIDPMMFEG